MTLSGRTRSAAALAVAVAMAVPAVAEAASSISVTAPRRIGVNQTFTMGISGFADPAGYSTPRSTVRVIVAGHHRSSGPSCLEDVNGGTSGDTIFFSGVIPAGSYSFTVRTRFPIISDNWVVCALSAQQDFTGQAAFAHNRAAARVVVVRGRVALREKAITVSLSPPSVAADGNGLSVASILATQGFDAIPNARLAVQPDPKPAAPRAVVCDTRGGGTLLWPGSRFQDGTRSVSGFDTRADGGGTKQLKVLTGSQGGQFSLSGTLKGQSSVFDLKQLALNAQGQGPFPADPRAFLTQLGHDYMEGSAPRFGAALALRGATAGTTLARQQAILEWLGFVRSPGLGFGPARRADGRGGVVLYPKGTAVRTASGFITPGAPRWVIDVDNLGTAVANSTTFGGIFRFPDLSDPRYAGVVLPFGSWVGGGFAAAGFAPALPNEDLAYFGYPEPPPVGAPGRNDFEGCLGLGIGGYLADVHSPARLLFKGAGGASLGLGPAGALLDVPGGFVSAPARGVARYHVPAGAYALDLTGTGSGKVTLVLSGPGAAQPSVFSFSARANAKGTLALSGRGVPRALTFGGRRVTATLGVGMRISGLPRSLKAGKRVRVGLRVLDQFGVAVAGAAVQAGSAAGATDARGRAALLLTPRRGRLNVVVSDPGHRSARASIPVR
ncbi:MAG: hypothetical protein QOI91_1080 [Solirubrobacteraceae bacterium]|nr:hypothetical protein [Solirubrobacteraceae bacterium]